jgi:hypothetical protein
MFLGFGLLFGLVGAVLGALWTQFDPAAEGRAIPQLSAAALSDSAAGREALVEGRLSERNRPGEHGLLVYAREELRGRGDDEAWVEAERFAPRLLVELPDGLAEVLSEGALLQSPPRAVEEASSVRVVGFGPGDPVVVVGRVADGPEGSVLAAELIAGGTRADYLAGLGAQRHVLLWIGGPFALLGLIFGGLGAWGLLRGWR